MCDAFVCTWLHNNAFFVEIWLQKKIVVFYWNENDCASVIHMTNLYGIRLIL